MNNSIKAKHKNQKKVSILKIISNMSHTSNDSDGHYIENDCYNRKVINKLCKSSKNDMKIICNKYGFD